MIDIKLLCRKIARLVNDEEGMTWLSYEYGGYPRGDNGYVERIAWNIASDHGRKYKDKDGKGGYSDYIFPELCGELEASIDSMQNSIRNYTIQGFSVSGDYATAATNSMTNHITKQTNNLLLMIKINEKRLSILRSQYYDYAVKWFINLSFENEAKKMFEEYQERVNKYFSDLPITIVQKINAIEDMMEDGNPERYSQVLTSCRRLWTETANYLFEIVLPNYESETFETKTGKK